MAIASAFTLRARVIAGASVVAVIAASLIASASAPVEAAPSTVSQTFSYTGAVQEFTVPAGITALTVTLNGGQGGNGGADATPAPPVGTYVGTVTGTIAVTPGQVLQIAVGSGGQTGVSGTNAATAARPGGNNPLAGYDGGNGGKSGTNGSSGQGGAGGAASVLVVDGKDIVAGGGGGNGGSGQFAPTRGRNADGTFVARTDVTSSNGQVGINAGDACRTSTCSNDDGGGSGGGGGGAQGGAQGRIEFGAGSSNEWFGYGGSVGENSVAGLGGLIASYTYIAQNSGNGSIVISYETGSPSAPSAVQGTPGVSSVNLSWLAPASSGGATITGYAVRYSSDNGVTWSTPEVGGTATSTTVTGLTNDVPYIFQVAAVNSFGTGQFSPSSAPITPRALPSAPSITAVAPRDGALALTVTPPASGAAPTGYEYRVDGGSWLPASGTSSPLVVPGLVNGVTYSVEIRATSVVGAGAASAPASGTPYAVPGAPTIDSATASRGALSLSVTPGFSGGSAITDYEVQLNGGAWTSVGTDIAPLALTGLADGTAYEVRVRAVNSAGAGAASSPITLATPGVPGALSALSATPGDRRATVEFATGANGGSAITGVEYSLDGVTWTPTTLSGPLSLTGLQNGTATTVRMRAVNAIGAGPVSSVSVTPATVPSAPSIVEGSVAGLDGALEVTFTAPTSDGGSAILRYEYSTDGGATWQPRADGESVASPLVITTQSSDGSTPLENGETYLVELRAVNAAGAGAASSVAPGVPTQAAAAPTITEVRSLPGAVAVSFAPGSNGGSEVLRYEYTLDDGATWQNTGSLSTQFTIGGLTDGVSVSVRVRAVTAVGDGAPSAAASGTPASAPDAPGLLTIVRGDRSLTVTTAPGDDGGSAVTRWEYSTDGGATWATAPGAGPTHVLTAPSADPGARLQNGVGYSVQMRAVNAVGSSPSSLPLYSAPATSPPAPSVTATASDSAVSVSFAFSDDGGSPLTRVEYTLDGATWTDSGTLAGPIVLTGLPNGEAVSVRVRGVNAIGDGTASSPATATPRTVPGAPSGVAAVSNTSSADVSWTAPASNGGAAVTGYRVSAYADTTATTPIASCTTSGATSCSVTGLANGTTYYVSVVASNVAGDGAASAPRVAVTPLQRPSAPTLSSLTAGDRMLRAAFSAGSLGGGTFVRYEYTLNGGTSWTTLPGGSSPANISDLTNGTTYTVALRTVTTAGPSPASNSLSATPSGYPAAPTAIEADGRNASIVVSWAAADANGGTILNYTATAFNAASGGSTITTCTTTGLTCTLTGLTNGTTYYISVQTQNTAAMYSVRSDRVAATPSTLPSAPRDLAATAGDGSAALTWTRPMGQGSSAITGYTVLCSNNGGTYVSCGTTTDTAFTATGLENGATYRFQVVANNSSGAGPAATSAAVTPLAAGVAPTFAAAESAAGGFTVRITNYDASATYALAAPIGVTATRSGDLITVTGLAPGAFASIDVTVTAPNSRPATASVSGESLRAGTAPVLSAASPILGGFQVSIQNLDPDTTYVLSVPGGSATRAGAVVTVTGLDDGATAVLTVTAQRSGYTDVSASRVGTALSAGVAPEFAAPVPTAAGFTVRITNYDSTAGYVLSVPGGSAARSGDVVTVTGLAAGASATLEVTVTAPGALPASASVTGTALSAGVPPVLTGLQPLEGGFRVVIDDYDPDADYVVVVDAEGATATRVGATVTVSGLADGAAATLTVGVQRDGVAPASSTVEGRALEVGPGPELSDASPADGGFSITIENYDETVEYSATTTAGTVTVVGDLVTVTGLEPGQTAEVTVIARKDGRTDASATVTGTAVPAGVAPTFDTPVSTTDGYTVHITNYDPTARYDLEMTGAAPVFAVLAVPAVTRIGDQLTVTGVAPGASAGVAVTALAPGTLPATSIVTGTALRAGTVPRLAEPVGVLGGFTIVIEDFDPDAEYILSVTNGTVRRVGDTIIVEGLAEGETATVTIVVRRDGYADVTYAVAGRALADDDGGSAGGGSGSGGNGTGSDADGLAGTGGTADVLPWGLAGGTLALLLGGLVLGLARRRRA